MSFVIGLDAHSKFSEFAVYKDSKKLVECKRINTSEEQFRMFIKKFPNPKVVIFEESTLSQWLRSVFLPYCDEVIICEPYANSLLYRTDQKSDKIDCRKLVQLYRLNLLRRVYYGSDTQHELKRLVLQYHSYKREVVRLKNQIHAKYRQAGIFPGSGLAYTPAVHAAYLEQLRSDSLRSIITGLLRIVNEIEKETREILQILREDSKKYLMLKNFMQIPGVGVITALTFFALIMTPERFNSKERLWSYCKIGIATSQSGGRIYRQCLTRRGNPLLKNVLIQASLKGIHTQDSCLSRMYDRLTSRGLSPALARITVARKIASTMYYIWLKKCSFDPAYIK